MIDNKKKIYDYNSTGMTLPITFVFVLASSGFVFAFYNKIFSKNWMVDRMLAEYKAELNAESGIAYAMANHLYRSDFECYNPTMVQNDEKNVRITGLYPGSLDKEEAASPYATEMGEFNVKSCYTESDINDRFNPYAISTGKAYIKNMQGKADTIYYNKRIELTSASSLSDFLYLTDSEKAGGAPFVFDGFPTYNNRREVNFGSGDSFNQLWPGSDPVCDVKVKSNGSIVFSNFGCPTFNNTVTVTENDEGEVNSPVWGSCTEDQVFQADVPLDTAKTTCLPPDGYDEMKAIIENSNRHIMLDATSKLNWNPLYFSRDTLIMTDIQFTEENGGGIKVKQWWFLMPPYLSTNVESPYVFANGMNNSNDGNCTLPQLYLCPQYVESMQDFHSKNVTTTGYDSFINIIVQSTYGFHHYDLPDMHHPNFGDNSANWRSQLNDSQLLPEYQDQGYKFYNYSRPTAIYVKGGPVRVHGNYKGRYTVVTDEYTAYNRHAWGSNLSASAGGARVDTLWNNIWIIDDIVNSDAPSNNNLLSAQPDEVNDLGCSGGSENVLGLVSGANVYVANTRENGARNNLWGQDVHIHAHIIAFNESFAVQYWQNTISTGGNTYSNPPYADGQGQIIYGNGGTTDYRGSIYLWGGVVQKFRGYTKRNNPGPYPTNDIGMDKNYNFDCNLKCNFPPLYPENIESSSCGNVQEEEKKFNVLSYE